ncbi:MAG: hypothetical protein H7Y86_15670 [Rhizobacter sp.]|nr:hypothetical protein [Ferruginibacter sp.]
MQVYTKTNWGKLKILFFFFAIVFVAFLPVSSFLFFLKNDAFTGYFPPKFFMSESLASGYLPFWNPYINFGFPQYGDMSGGYWSPVTWLIASTVGYNAYTFTLEVFFYIFLGGIGMYQLTRHWQLGKRVRLITAVAFMCCGYYVGHLQHFNWLSGAAFLPWCLWSYLLLANTPSLKVILLNVVLFYLLLSSAHPGIIIGAVYFFIAVAGYYFFSAIKDSGNANSFKKSIWPHTVFILLLLLVSTGMIAGYADIIPHFVRGNKNSFPTGPSDSSSFQSWTSILFPLSTVKNDSWFVSDLSLRDSYFSLPLLLFFFLSLLTKKTGWQKFLLGLGTFFFLLSVGGIFQDLASRFLPLIGYVRLNGEFRIFSILSFILIAAIELNKYFKEEKKFEGTIRWVYYAVELIIITSIVWSVYQVISTKQSLLFHTTALSSQGGIINSLKFFIDNASYYDCLLIQSVIQLFITWFIKLSLKRKDSFLLLKVIMVDMVAATLLMVPFTGAGKASLKQVQEVLNNSPKGIPVPTLQPVNNNDTIPSNKNELIGSWSMFSKQIGNVKEVPYPIQLKTMKEFFKDTYMQNELLYFNKPFVFIKDNNDSFQVKINSFSPNKMQFVVIIDEPGKQLILQQNNYPHWIATVNGKEGQIVTEGAGFMSIPLQKGKNEVIFLFEPSLIKKAMLVSFLAFIVVLSCLLFLLLKPKSLSLS